MKRIQYHRYGGPEEMRLEMADLPPPGRGEILVRVKAAAINPFDWKVRQGKMKLFVRGKFPRGMGTDFSGIVESVGPGVTRFRAGDEVLGTTPLPGTAFAERLVTQERLVLAKPRTLAFDAAAALPVVGITAWRALLSKGRLQAGQRVFINGAYGGVGQAAVHIALAQGAAVAGRVGPGALAEGAALGLDPVLDYTKHIPASLHGQFDIVLDTNGSLTPAEGAALIKRSGVVVDTNPSTAKVIKSLTSRHRALVFGTPDIAILQKIVDLAAAGKMPLPIGRTAPLDEGAGLIAALEAGSRVPGKAVITVA